MTSEERKALVRSYLGKTVTIKTDRPIGSAHPKHADMIYPINYGYIPHVFGGDGEELDVYLLGVDRPVEEYTARIIAIVHRRNDTEDKLVAAPEGMTFHQAEIAEAVHFQERYYDSEIEPMYWKSCGAVLFRIRGGQKEYLLLHQKRSGTWSFPKGTMEPGETECETAVREIFEETGIKISLDTSTRCEVTAKYSDTRYKTVVLFRAKINIEPKIKPDEIAEYRFSAKAEAEHLLPPHLAGVLDADQP